MWETEGEVVFPHFLTNSFPWWSRQPEKVVVTFVQIHYTETTSKQNNTEFLIYNGIMSE